MPADFMLNTPCIVKYICLSVCPRIPSQHILSLSRFSANLFAGRQERRITPRGRCSFVRNHTRWCICSWRSIYWRPLLPGRAALFIRPLSRTCGWFSLTGYRLHLQIHAGFTLAYLEKRITKNWNLKKIILKTQIEHSN